jgi:AraC-like DNA-binding protein
MADLSAMLWRNALIYLRSDAALSLTALRRELSRGLLLLIRTKQRFCDGVILQDAAPASCDVLIPDVRRADIGALHLRSGWIILPFDSVARAFVTTVQSSAVLEVPVNALGQEKGCVGAYFGVPDAPCLTTTPVRSSSFCVTRVERQLNGDEAVVVDLPASDSYLLMLYLENTCHADLRPDGTLADARIYRQGSICLVDLAQGASILLRESLNALAFFLPRALFDELAEMSNTTRLHHLRCRRGEADPVIESLGIALLPLFESGHASPPALLQHLASAICAHVLHDYSDEAMRNGAADSSLAVWQEKAVKEYMLDHLGEDLSIALIASSIGYSANHFGREFKRATGLTPHQWLTRMRVEKAKQMLAQTSPGLATIADLCGFTDQSHFTKVFQRATGMTPAVWRNSAIH